MDKVDIIYVVESMGFHLDYDQWDEKGQGWMRFKLKDDLDEKDLRLIWYKDDLMGVNFKRTACILFKAGQKEKMKQMQKYTEL